MNRSIIKHPLVTEKGTAMAAMGKYIFLVSDSANGPEVRKVIKAIYNVDVISTNIINAKPKKRRLGRSVGIKPGYKKMIITLKKGQKLDVMPGA